MSDAGLVYHFTDTARLPWIMASGELQPGRNRIGGFPDPDFLWATTDPQGDGSSSVHSGDGYRFGRVLHVRFTMRADDFERWPDVTRAFPKWTRGQIRRLEKAAGGKSSPSAWRCRIDSLPLNQCVAIETRGYGETRWTALPPTAEAIPTMPGWLAMLIDARLFASRRVSGPHGSTGYEI